MPTPAIIKAMREAVAHHQAGRLAQAEQIYQRVLQQDPRDPDALQLLGLLHFQAGRNELAIDLIMRAIAVRAEPNFYVNLSQAQKAIGKVREAIESCRRAIELMPALPEAWNNLGSLLNQTGQATEAVAALQKAVSLRPDYAAAWNNLGNALVKLTRGDEGEAAFRRALEIDPNYAPAHVNLGNFLSLAGRLDESIAASRRAIALGTHDAAAYGNLGIALHLQGRFDEGNAALQKCVKLQPNDVRSAENLLGGMTYTTRFSKREIVDAHVKWAERFANPLTPPTRPPRQPHQKIRVGYISPDFKRHSVAYFFEPILEHHDRSQFEIFGYSNVERADEVTDRLRGKCDHWRDVVPMSDDEVATQIKSDQIDVMVDLAGHTLGNRLLALARRPAAVNVTYLGYPETTGVAAIDWRITDELADPPGEADRFHTEKLWRVPAPFVRYRPPEQSPPVAEAPAKRNGYVTFGSFNKAAKAGPETIALWAKVLQALPTSRMLMKAQGLRTEGSRRRLIDGFTSHGIDASRVELIEAEQSFAEHLAMYGRIDVALDTFPYHGTTTTCEALWMGVPVVSLIGDKHVSRVGLSLLTAVGHPEWTADSVDAFVAIALQTAMGPHDRSGLRQQMHLSPLCDAAGLARSLELAYQQMLTEIPITDH